MGLSASRAASWESAGAAKASVLGKFAVVTCFCADLQLCPVLGLEVHKLCKGYRA